MKAMTIGTTGIKADESKERSRQTTNDGDEDAVPESLVEHKGTLMDGTPIHGLCSGSMVGKADTLVMSARTIHQKFQRFCVTFSPTNYEYYIERFTKDKPLAQHVFKSCTKALMQYSADELSRLRKQDSEEWSDWCEDVLIWNACSTVLFDKPAILMPVPKDVIAQIDKNNHTKFALKCEGVGDWNNPAAWTLQDTESDSSTSQEAKEGGQK